MRGGCVGTSDELARRIEETLGRMTLEQKCALLSGKSAFGTRAYPKLGIPELQFSDGPHGIRHQDPKLANHLACASRRREPITWA